MPSWVSASVAAQWHRVVYQVFGSKMGIPPEHLHGLVTADCSQLLITQPSFYQSVNSFMANIVKAEVIYSGFFLRLVPELGIGPALTVLSRLTKEH